MNKINKNVIIKLIVFLLCFFIFVASKKTVAAVDESQYDKIYHVTTADELIQARDEINSNTSGDKKYAVILENDIESTRFSIYYNNVTLVGNGHTVKFLGTDNGFGVEKANGAVLNLGLPDGTDTLVIQGSTTKTQGPFGIVNGTNTILNMYNGVTIKDHIGNNYYGGAVEVRYGTFHMYGGTIENCGIDGGSVCYGGGVAVINGSVFVMDGGTIKNCFVNSDYVGTSSSTIYCAGGGVLVSGGSAFVMNDGTISNCRAGGNQNAVGGGVFVCNSNGNAVSDFNSAFIMNNGIIDSCSSVSYGGGIGITGFSAGSSAMAAPNDSQFKVNKYNSGIYINGGTVSNNTITKEGEVGIGISLCCIKVPVEIKNCTITGNHADMSYGGGIGVRTLYTKALIENCKIINNSAYGGAGIAIYQNYEIVNNASAPCNTTLKNTTITSNVASGDIGGGVFCDNSSKLTIVGKNIIQNNTCVNESQEVVNNNLHIWDKNHPVYVGGDLTGSKIGITDEDLYYSNPESMIRLTQDYKDKVGNINPYEYFISDHDGWYADFGEKNIIEEKKLVQSTTKESWSNSYAVNFNGFEQPKATSVGAKFYFGINSEGKGYVTTTSSTNTKQIYMIAHGKSADKKFYIGYKINDTSFCVIKEWVGYTANKFYTVDEVKEATGLDFGNSYAYIRGPGMSDGNCVKNYSIYNLEEQTVTSGTDFSNEVKLYKSGSAEVTKVSKTNSLIKIENVEFTIYYKKSEGTYTDADKVNVYEKNGEIVSGYQSVKKSDISGNVVFENLLQGDYVIKETASINGYALNDTYYDVSIKKDNLKEIVTVENDVTKYKIIYELYNGINSANNPGEYTIESNDIVFEDASKDYYDFKGWYEDESFYNAMKRIISGTIGDIKVYAKWEAKKYKIILHSNGGIIAEGKDITEYSYEEETVLPNEKEIIKDGYVFKGWYTNENLEGNSSTLIEKYQSGDKEFYAKWSKIYNIEYELNNGINSEKNLNTYIKETDTIIFENPERENYTFAGWYIDEEFKNKIECIETGSQGDIKVFAKWVANKYKVILHSNEGIILEGKDITEYSYEEETFLPNEKEITKDGYVFKGWYINENLEGNSSTLIEKYQSGDKEFYAKWEKIEENKQEEEKKPNKDDKTEKDEISEENKSESNVQTGDKIIKYIGILILCFGLYVILPRTNKVKRSH